MLGSGQCLNCGADGRPLTKGMSWLAHGLYAAMLVAIIPFAVIRSDQWYYYIPGILILLIIWRSDYNDHR